MREERRVIRIIKRNRRGLKGGGALTLKFGLKGGTSPPKIARRCWNISA